MDLPKAIEFPKLIPVCVCVTIQNDPISYVKHVLAPLCVFFTVFGCWGGGAKGAYGTTDEDLFVLTCACSCG